MKGHLVVGGHRFEITAIRLREGQTWFYGTGRGPIEPMSKATITIFGEDGIGVGQIEECVDLPHVRRGERVDIDFPIRHLALTHEEKR